MLLFVLTKRQAWYDDKEDESDKMAQEMTPSSANSIHHEFSNENRRKLCECDQCKIEKLIASKILHIQLTTNIQEIIHHPEKKSILIDA